MRSTLITSSILLAAFLTACGTEQSGDLPTSNADARGHPMSTSTSISVVLDTYIPEWIQIDNTCDGCSGDANLYVEDDPADSSLSYDLPAGGTTYVDWDDLPVASHRFMDLNVAGGKDLTAFPRSNSCVGGAMVLGKMDLTYVGAASNDDWAYFIAQRSANTGDAAYYWIITREEPTLDDTSTACRSGEALLTYDIRGPDLATGASGDLLMMGHFHSSAAQLRVFQAVGDVDDVMAKDALDYTDTTMWSELTENYVVAINTTETRAGEWGTAGVKATDGVDLDTELIAELAVDISYVVGEETCGGQFYGSVVTRSSASGELSPDMKDLAGPFVLQMQSLEGYATLEPTCDGTVFYSAGDVGGTDVTCDWVFDDGTTVSDDCDGEVAVTPGNRTATVTITSTVGSCAVDVVTDAVDVGDVLSATADVTATCDLAFDYTVDVTGGSGTLSYEWSFTDEGGAVVDTSDAASGSVTVATAGTYTGSVTVTDDRGGGLLCTAEDDDPVDVLTPLSVDPDLVGSCDETATYDANVSGGTGGHTVSWTFSDGSTSTTETGTLTLGTQPTGGVEVTGTVEITDERPDGLTCETGGNDAAMVYSPVTVSLTAGTAGATCPTLDGGGTADAATWTAAIAGGTGDFTYDWTVAACDGAVSCTVDPADNDLCASVDVRLNVLDAGVCADQASETETYTKYTVVEATDL